jgi:hypothetical protein
MFQSQSSHQSSHSKTIHLIFPVWRMKKSLANKNNEKEKKT